VRAGDDSARADTMPSLCGYQGKSYGWSSHPLHRRVSAKETATVIGKQSSLPAPWYILVLQISEIEI